MSKSKVNAMLFSDKKGMLCAIREDYCSVDKARSIAKQKLFCETVKKTNEYNHMYFGYGKSDGESESTWWLVDNKTKNGIPVYVFREC